MKFTSGFQSTQKTKLCLFSCFDYAKVVAEKLSLFLYHITYTKRIDATESTLLFSQHVYLDNTKIEKILIYTKHFQLFLKKIKMLIVVCRLYVFYVIHLYYNFKTIYYEQFKRTRDYKNLRCIR